MRPRFVVYTVVATLLIGTVAFAADAFFVSDREQLEQLSDELTSGAPADAVLRWTDPSREPVTVRHDGVRDRFDEQDDYLLSERMAEALAPLAESDRDVVQQSVRVNGERGTVALRVRSEGDLHDVTLRLARNGQGWLVTDVLAR